MDAPNADVVSTGFVARKLNCSVSVIKKWERNGAICPAIRVLGSDRRVWRVSDLPQIEEQVTQLLRGSGRRVGRAAA